MTYPTREQIEEYIRNNKLDADESYPRSDWWKFKQQRDAYKQQRNELIEDMAKLRERNAALERKLDKEVKLSYEIEGNLYDVSKERDKIINDMAEVKEKAKAFDEILDINIDKDEFTNEEYIEKVNDVIQEWIFS
ncbi:hypothetical protein CJ234_07700 [Staphylococcus sp. UMB0328]|uniref:hypothetical protein n=1 Tax=Staphylococcus sp. UMB0328 TaxID=2029110 RepID=UPI000CBC34AA|nr:hypothetical protein [Staphylococcus sp. UMB0328]PMB95123.1 hypothetical protein CJ234_07700 [Staphylococcus sp. UMB0328]